MAAQPTRPKPWNGPMCAELWFFVALDAPGLRPPVKNRPRDARLLHTAAVYTKRLRSVACNTEPTTLSHHVSDRADLWALQINVLLSCRLSPRPQKEEEIKRGC